MRRILVLAILIIPVLVFARKAWDTSPKRSQLADIKRNLESGSATPTERNQAILWLLEKHGITSDGIMKRSDE